jgi:hypothetical protein
MYFAGAVLQATHLPTAQSKVVSQCRRFLPADASLATPVGPSKGLLRRYAPLYRHSRTPALASMGKKWRAGQSLSVAFSNTLSPTRCVDVGVSVF